VWPARGREGVLSGLEAIGHPERPNADVVVGIDGPGFFDLLIETLAPLHRGGARHLRSQTDLPGPGDRSIELLRRPGSTCFRGSSSIRSAP